MSSMQTAGNGETRLASWAPVAIVARELRKPIGAIRSAMSVMESAAKLPGAMDQARRLIGRQVGELSVLVDDLLELESLARGTLRLRRDWIDLVPEVEAAVSGCSWAFAGHTHSLVLQVPDEPVYGYVDPSRLRQVIVNLLDNACRYTRVPGRVSLRLEHAAREAVVTVADDGPGISRDRLPHVFDFLHGSPSSTDEASIRPEIGLAVVRELVHLHGGSVEARSAGAGRGSAFIVRWPLGYPLLLPQIP